MNSVTIPNNTMKTVNIELPASEYNFLKTLSKKMGWIAKPIRTKHKKNEIDLALEEVKNGNVVSFNNVDDAIAYLNS